MTEKTRRSLDRMAALQAIMNKEGDATPDSVYWEYRKLLGPMVQEFVPVVQKLIEAGLLTIHLDRQALQTARQWAKDVSPVTGKLDSLSFEPEWSDDNGNIWIWVGEVCSASGADQYIKNN